MFITINITINIFTAVAVAAVALHARHACLGAHNYYYCNHIYYCVYVS